jgi:hypothetical protein
VRAISAFCADQRPLESWTSYMRGTRAILHPPPGDRAGGRRRARSPPPSPRTTVASVSRITITRSSPRRRAGLGHAQPAPTRRRTPAESALGSGPRPPARAQRVLICASGLARGGPGPTGEPRRLAAGSTRCGTLAAERRRPVGTSARPPCSGGCTARARDRGSSATRRPEPFALDGRGRGARRSPRGVANASRQTPSGRSAGPLGLRRPRRPGGPPFAGLEALGASATLAAVVLREPAPPWGTAGATWDAVPTTPRQPRPG